MPRNGDEAVLDRVQSVQIDNRQWFGGYAFSVAGSDDVVWLTLLVDGEGKHNHQHLIDTLNDLVLIIKQQIDLVYEINEMANELGERYEELNLIYTRDHGRRTPKQDRQLLRKMVAEFVNYLGVDMTILAVPDRSILYAAGEKYTSSDCQLSNELRSLTRSVYSVVCRENASVVINEPCKRSNSDLSIISEQRLLAAPVRAIDNSIKGMLVCVSSIEQPEFTNSDRNLLAVMADKVSEILKAGQDPLTGLLNRSYFILHAEEILAAAVDHHAGHVMCTVNIDRIKIVNDTYGPAAGDYVMAKLGQLLGKITTDRNIVGRLGGDEFGILVCNSTIEKGEKLAQLVCRAAQQIQIHWQGREIETSVSVAVVDPEECGGRIVDALNAAELTLSKAKEKGRNRVEVYRAGRSDLSTQRQLMHCVEKIKLALKNDRFVLYCQRIEPLVGDDVHYELLVRMLDEDNSVIAPATFLGAAERFWLMPEVDYWVLLHALETLEDSYKLAWDDSISWGINLSGQSLGEGQLLDFIGNWFGNSRVPARQVYFEITETAAIDHVDTAVQFINQVKKIGCRFALDDFGSGLSSFAYLKNFPVDYLKIDGAFVRNMVHDEIDRAMVESIAHIGRVMGLRTIAEFVENDSILQALKGVGVDYAQGYAIMKPLPLSDELVRLQGERRARESRVQDDKMVSCGEVAVDS
ncbi:MAG: EAL domain-containing protein, partial [Anaerolineae bacterium]